MIRHRPFHRRFALGRPLILLMVLGLVTAPALAACATTDSPQLNVANGTELTISVSVNGVRFADFRPGQDTADLSTPDLPPLPWVVEARSSSGRLLLSMRVRAQDLATSLADDGRVVESGVAARIDLSCGRLTMWTGISAPSGPMPEASAGQPGDCIP